MKRHTLNLAPEVAPKDLESSPIGQTQVFGGGQTISMAGTQVFGGGQTISMAGTPLNIQPYQALGSNGYGKSASSSGKSSRQQDAEGFKKVALIAGAIWLGGCFLGYDWMWPLYVLINTLNVLLSTPPLSWLFGWVATPLSWLLGWASRGAPLVNHVGALQELRLPPDQVSTYLDSYVQQYGDAALIFAAHDGYPQIVNGFLFNRDLGYRDLVDATDDNGNTALIYTTAKGYRQCTAALLRNGADPEIANQGGGGRTPLMEAAGAGNKDIVSAIRLYNATLDTTDDFGNTALHYAAYHGHLTVVHELLKGSPRKDIKNSYGHTPLSYAQANKHKAIVDVLSRVPTKREKLAQESVEKAEKEKAVGKKEDFLEEMVDLIGAKKPHHEKHVKGAAEDLHKKDPMDFMPKLEHGVRDITDTERKALEDQIAKLKRQHEESELKAQRRIVELLEKSAAQQKALDEAERHTRTLQLNTTELSIKIQELQSRHQGSELRVTDEKHRADRLQEDVTRVQFEVDRHRSRADGAERERDMHMEASRRHEENLRQKFEEAKDHLSRIERQTHEMATLRENLRRREEELRQAQETIAQLQRQVQGTSGAGNSAPLASSAMSRATTEGALQSSEGADVLAVPATQSSSGREPAASSLGEFSSDMARSTDVATAADSAAVNNALATSAVAGTAALGAPPSDVAKSA